jgi:hypothetical protein
VFEIPYGKTKNAIDERLATLEVWHRRGGVFVMSYSLFASLANSSDETKPKLSQNQIAKVNTYLCSPGPDLIVCDEGHTIKNHTTQVKRKKTEQEFIVKSY